MCSGVLVADAREAAARAGLRGGDRIIELNDTVPIDVLDLEDAAADGVLWLSVLRDGHPLQLVVRPRSGEWHGISLDQGGLGDAPRTCCNACRFCFVDQVPVGLRPALSVKDDDYRLSFLHGNFVTLTNLDESDVSRIEGLGLSPLYVSLHAWDDAARVALMGRAAARSRRILERLAAAGIELHLQVVLCPGWNDGAVLTETIRHAGELPAVADLGVVPVSLAVEGDVRRVTADEARKVIKSVEAWQREFRGRRGAAVVHAADELYLLAGLVPPRGDAPEQYENGVGISAALLDEAATLAAAWRLRSEGTARGVPGELAAAEGAERCGALSEDVVGVRLLGGVLAGPVLRRAAAVLEGAAASTRAATASERGAAAGAANAPKGSAAASGGAAPVHVRPFLVENRVFGPHVTVTGLLGGAEVLDALEQEPLAEGEWLLAPRTWIPSDLGRTLDDIGEDEVKAACGGRLILAESLRDAFVRLFR